MFQVFVDPIAESVFQGGDDDLNCCELLECVEILNSDISMLT